MDEENKAHENNAEKEKPAHESKPEERVHTHKEGNLTKKMRENPWILSTFVLGVLALILLVGNFNGTTGEVVSENQAGDAIMSFVRSQGADAELVGVEEDGNFYEVTILYQGQDIPLYATKDGEFLVQGLTPLNREPSNTPQPQPTEVPRSDKPEVELFVMTHCPYGTQAEKGFIPAILELGDSIDASIKFVHYFLHEPEETETPIQICIREEQEDKFLPYLKCFLEDGDSDRCLTEAKVNKAKLNTCVDNKYEDLYVADSALSEGYGVRGSPTLIVNGVESKAGRSAQAYLDGICVAFNEAPEACSTVLDDATPSPGFGYGESTGIASAQC
jgi:protein-disulfide isomerase